MRSVLTAERCNKMVVELYDDEAESIVLGAILAYNNRYRCMDEVKLTGLKVEDFYNQEHKLLYRLLDGMEGASQQIMINTVSLEVKKQGLTNTLPPLYLSGLMERVGPGDARPKQIKKYVETIKDYSRRRQGQDIGCILQSDFADMNKPLNETVAAMQDCLTALMLADDDTAFETPKDYMMRYAHRFFVRQTAEGDEYTGLKTGYTDLDNAIIGLRPGDLTILAARPSMGKTCFALNVIASVCDRGQKVLLVSEETPRDNITDRILSAKAVVPYKDLREGKLDDDRVNKCVSGMDAISKWSLDILDRRVTVAEIKARAQLTKAKFKGLDLIVVDHLQLTKGDGRYKGDKVHEVGEISHALKDLAVRMQVPVIALSQLSRASTLRDDKRPQLSDLRESGDIEQDADLVLALHRPAYYTRDDNDHNAELIILKARDAELQTIELFFFGLVQKFVQKSDKKER